MRALAVIVLLGCSAAASAAWYSHRSAQPWEDLIRRELHRSDCLDRLMERRFQFVRFMDDCCEELTAGVVSVDDTVTKILAYAKIYYPEYLRHLTLHASAADEHKRIVENLYEHLRFREASSWRGG